VSQGRIELFPFPATSIEYMALICPNVKTFSSFASINGISQYRKTTSITVK
jgi:hypothetical protein